MKLAEAAAILGVHPDTQIETLKQTYRRLALAWHPDKCSNPNAKEKFQQISIAYTKLISAQSIGGKRLEDEESDDDSGAKRGDESHEMAAFMRMFMDLVGIFNEDQSLSEDGKIPAAGVSFGMMFGSRPGTAEEWSTEDEADVEEVDEEQEEEDGEFYDSETEEGVYADGTAWEPPAKQYSQMNLKEEVSKERQSKLTEETEQNTELAEAKRKLKNAKKRAEKRRKQKEKKLREAAMKEEEEGQLRQLEETKKREEEEAAAKLEDDLRILREAKVTQRLDLFEVLRSGDCARVKTFIGETLDQVKRSRTTPLSAAFRQRASVMRELIASQPLLHCCVGKPPSRDNEVASKSTAEGRLAIAEYLLSLRNHPINLSTTDSDGRTALHLAAKKEDSAILKLLLAAREESVDRRAQLDINARCGKSGWTFLHYAAGQGDVAAVRLLMEAGASVIAHAVIGKAVTPLDLVKTRLQNAGHFSAAHISNLQLVAKELGEAVRTLEKVKQLKEAERLLKEEKLEAARKKLAEREEKERELLERKQKQLKDKQDRDRSRVTEDDSKKILKSCSGTTTQSALSVGSKSSGTSVSGIITLQSSHSASPSTLTTPSSSNTSVGAVTDPPDKVEEFSKSSKKKKKKDKKMEEDTAPKVEAESKVTVVDITSRDELVDHLLAMGFAEADCFSAVSLHGMDLDRSLSWLCDRPSQASENTHITATNGMAPRSYGMTTHGANPVNDNVSQSAENARLQKEKDHKEELRRVNRAWNIKAEDEKKRAETEKRLKEEGRQSDIQQLQQKHQLQQELQIQQQQQQLQLLAIQQQQQQQQMQPLQRSPSAPTHSYGTNFNPINISNNVNITTSSASANRTNATNILNMNSILNGGTGGTNLVSDPQRDLRKRDHSFAAPFPSSGPGPFIPQVQILQNGVHLMNKTNPRNDRPLGYQQSQPLSPSGTSPIPSARSSSMFGLNTINQNMNANLSARNPYNNLGQPINPGTMGPQMGLNSVRDEILGGQGQTRGSFRGPAGPAVGSSYDVTAYNELRAQALRMRGMGSTLGVPHSMANSMVSGISAHSPMPGSPFKGLTGQIAPQGPRGPGGGGGPPPLLQLYESREPNLPNPPQLRTPSQNSYPPNGQHIFLRQTLSQNQNSVQNLQTQGPPQLRPQNAAFAPLGFDDTGRPRNSHPLPAGQSQQVFQSQQQLQEQESSRLHHQSQQYLFVEHSSEDDEFVDNSLELSIKAKPFIPQYPSSKSSNSPIAPPMLSHSHNSDMTAHLHQSPGQSYLNMNNASMNISALNSSSSSISSGMPVPTGLATGGMADSWGSIGPARSTGANLFGSNSLVSGSSNVMGMGMGMNREGGLGHLISQRGTPGLGQSAQGQGSGQGLGLAFDKHLGTGNGFNMSLLSSSLSGNSSPSSLLASRSMPHSPQYSQPSQYSAIGSLSSDRTTQSSSSSGYSSSLGSSHIRGIASMELYGSDLMNKLDHDPFSDGMPSLLSGLLMSSGPNLGGNLGMSVGTGTRDSFATDKYSHLMDSEEGGNGIGSNLFDLRDPDGGRDGESGSGSLLTRLARDQDPFGGGVGILPPSGSRSFPNQSSVDNDAAMRAGINSR